MISSIPLRAAVIGLGRMGMHHVRACVDAPNIDLVAILDHKPDWAVTVGAETQSLVAADVESLFGKVDMAIIAVPTADHGQTAIPLLGKGVSCLVEKPIAATEAEAEAMIAAAESGGATLQIGHIERFNPAVDHLVPLLKEAGPVSRISVRRHNMLSDRPYDIDAVLDLMIHDLDFLSVISAGDVRNVTVEDGAVHHRIAAHLTCGPDTAVHISVDRDAEEPVRDLVIETEGGTFTLDFSANTLSRKTGSGSEDLPVEPGDPIRRQLSDFAAAVRSGEGTGARGAHGLAALRLANRVRTAAGLG